MDESHENSEEHQYLIHALWTINEDGHGHGHSLHRVYEGTATGPWDPEAYIEKYVTENHPQWLPNGVGQIGLVNEKVDVHSITIFKVSDKDETSWGEWTKAAQDKRGEVDKKRSYDADMMTIALLKKKWGLGERGPGEQELAQEG